MWPFTRRKPKPAPISHRKEPAVVAYRSFKAAQVDRLKGSWGLGVMTVNELIRRDLRTLRSRSRNAGENDPYARRFLNLLRSNVVGPEGVLFQSRIPGPNGTLDRPLNQAMEKAWKKWIRAENCDIAGKVGFAEFCRQFIATVAEDGECIVRLIEGREAGPFGFALQFIDAERIEITLDREAGPVQNAIRMGVEIDTWSRPVAYWFSSREGEYYYLGKRYDRIDAREIIHAYLPFRSGAWRGLPWTAASLVRLNMLDGFEDASLVNARVGASKMGFFLTEDGQAPLMGVEQSNGSVEISAEPGEFETLPGNVRDFREFNPAYPQAEFPSFVKQILRGVSAGLGVSYHTLSGDLEAVNFTSGRMGTQEDREIWKALQNWLINDALLTRIFARWMRNALLNRMVAGARLENEAIYLDSASWQPRRWPHIQPREESASRELALQMRLASRSRFIRDDGLDPDEVWAEIEAEEKTMRDRGIDPTLPGVNPPADTPDPSEPVDPALAA
jgi:lambda family phage portal protein